MYLGAWRNALYDWEGGFGYSKVLSTCHIQGNALCHADLCHTSPLACLKVLIHCRQRKGHFVGEDVILKGNVLWQYQSYDFTYIA